MNPIHPPRGRKDRARFIAIILLAIAVLGLSIADILVDGSHMGSHTGL